jgi:hypothetical protein
MTTRRTVRRSRLRRTLVAALPLLAFATVLWVKPMGLLLWARLRILTNIPRTAVADPAPPKLPRFPDLTGGQATGADSVVRVEKDGESEGGAKSRPEPADDERGL